MTINYSALHNCCNMGFKTLRAMGEFKQCTKHGGYTFIDRDANILAVAHIDTVQNSRKFYKNATKVYSPRFDDRLGVYTLLHQLNDLKFDILLTEDEESMQSTAIFFESEKSYNWMFQFDRGGTDVVMYQYDTQENRQMLRSCGFPIGIGSYTDICELDHLGSMGFNFGTAYYHGHSLGAYMVVDEYLKNIERFHTFYDQYSTTALEHTPNTYEFYRWDNDTLTCPVCDIILTEKDIESVYIYGMCEQCCYYVDRYNCHKENTA